MKYPITTRVSFIIYTTDNGGRISESIKVVGRDTSTDIYFMDPIGPDLPTAK